MQTTDASGAALTAATLDAISSPDCAWDERATIAWPGGLYPNATPMIVSAETDGTLTGGLPDQARRPVGFQSRTLKLVLSGMVDGTDETFDVFALLNPLNSASPFYRTDLRGTKLTYDVGPYVRGSATPQWIRQFTGEIDDITINAGGTVTLDCLDRMTELRPVVAMPAVVTAPPYNAGLTPEFGHDALLRNASNGTISSWPAQRSHCIASVGFRSSTEPEVGTIDISHVQYTPSFTPGAWGTAYAGVVPPSSLDFTKSYWAGTAYLIDTSKAPLSNALAFEATVTGVDPTGNPAMRFSYGQPYAFTHVPGLVDTYSVKGLSVTVSDTGIGVSTTAGSDFWTTAIDSQPHTILFWSSISGSTLTAHVKIDGGASHAFAPISFSDDTSLWTTALVLASVGTVEAWQTSTETAPVSSYPFTPAAVLDSSASHMQVTPAVSGDPLTAFEDICAADLTTAGFDEKGVYRSTSRISRRGGTAVGSYRSDTTLGEVELQLTGAGYANRVQAPVSTWKFTAPGTVWSTESVRVIPGRRTGYSFIVSTGDALVAAVDGSLSVLPDAGGNDGNSYYRASTDSSGLTAHTGLKNGRVAQIDSTHFRVTFDNTWTTPAYLVTPVGYSDHDPGFPTLQIGGIAVAPADTLLADSQWPPAAEGGAKTTPVRGEVPYVYPENGWRQDFTSAQVLTDDTLCEMRRPVLDITRVEITRPNPTLQLGDRIHLYAPNLYLDDDVTVFGIHNSSSYGEAAQTLDVRLVAAPGVLILGLPGRCELGVNTYV